MHEFSRKAVPEEDQTMKRVTPIRKLKGRVPSLLIASLILLISGCGVRVSEEEREAVYNLIEWNLYYARSEDLNGYMWTLHPDAPGYDDTQSQMDLMFREFDLAYTIEEWEIVSIDQNSARVRVIQTTRKVAGDQPFRDNRMEAIHILRKDSEGAWKIYATEFDPDDLMFLNE
jgi:hypothetical protein